MEAAQNNRRVSLQQTNKQTSRQTSKQTNKQPFSLSYEQMRMDVNVVLFLISIGIVIAGGLITAFVGLCVARMRGAA